MTYAPQKLSEKLEDFQKLTEQNRVMREALQWYASAYKFYIVHKNPAMGAIKLSDKETGMQLVDGNLTAQEALKKAKGEVMETALNIPSQPKYCPDEKTEKEINEWFVYHSPKEDQPIRYELLRNSAKVLAAQIICNVPPCADRTAALRKLRECIMTANAAIACNE